MSSHLVEHAWKDKRYRYILLAASGMMLYWQAGHTALPEEFDERRTNAVRGIRRGPWYSLCPLILAFLGFKILLTI
jgi:hypothetical protein